MKATLPILPFVLALAATRAHAQNPVEDFAPSQFSLLRGLPSTDSVGTYKALAFKELTGDLYTDAVLLQGTQLRMVRNIGRYEYVEAFGGASNACTTVSGTPAAVISCEAAGLKRYTWSSGTFSMSGSQGLTNVVGEPSWANCTSIESVQLSANTYITGCKNANEVLIGRISGSQILSGRVLAVGGTVADLCVFDWNNDGAPEVAVASTSGLHILNANAQTIYAWLGDFSTTRFARLPQAGGDRLVMLIPDSGSGMTYLTLAAPPPSVGAPPPLDPPCWFPMSKASDVVVTDYNADGLPDVIAGDATPSQTLTQAWIAYQAPGAPQPGNSRFYGELVPNNGIINHFVFHQSAPTQPLLIAAADYDNDGDMDLTGVVSALQASQPVRKLALMPSATMPAIAEWVTVPYPFIGGVSGQGDFGPYECDMQFTGVHLPNQPPAFPGIASNPISTANALQVAVWWRNPVSSGGLVNSSAALVDYIQFTPGSWNTSLPTFQLEFDVPNIEGVTLEIQYTLVQRNFALQTNVISGPSLTGYYEIPALGGGDDNPTTLPTGGQPAEPSIQPPFGHTTP